ncbi:hypothetical protein BGZ61DRAFT_540499 [Ilyonectria robusta]|uniref:uncharacterized protein n=1 Tax=Ilyonectria robusta TaxID=1079257 RepID=UPI001E8DD8CF|nr:uncharacterized protein BGZ61DRAFT_540499 [Ilyonectria robusta]KAH8658571.1 hypothetical protein BGZ61DRAFT_540499 [Ilyonectria robusta]
MISLLHDRDSVAFSEDEIGNHLRHMILEWNFNVSQIFEIKWADGGNLHGFWRNKSRKGADSGLVLRSIKQILGLSHALEDLHVMNCRYRHIKPGKVLHFFEDGGDGGVQPADLGFAKFHSQSTSLRQDPTGTKASTCAYEPPEVNELNHKLNPRSRIYDSWSMDCIILGFVVSPSF